MKHNIRKLLSIIVSISMLISMMICPAYADAKSTLTLTGGNLSKGETIDIPVVLSGVDSGITSFSFHLKYDEENLKFTGADIRSGFTGLPNVSENLIAGFIGSPDKGTDPVCTLHFTTNDNVLNGNYSISLEKGEEDDAMFLCNDDIIPDSSIEIKDAIVTVTGGTDKLTNDNTEISGINASYEYTGSAIKPVPTVKYNGKTLKVTTDYTVSYSNNTEIGTAKITITGTGSYIGSAEKEFKITKKAVEIKVSKTSHSKTYGDETFNIGASVYSGAELSYSSSNTDVASVDNSGNVIINKAGDATITVSAPETDNYQKPDDKKITVNIAKADYNVTLSSNEASVKVGTSDLSFLPTASTTGVKGEKPEGTLKFYSDSARKNELTSDYVKSLSVDEKTGYKLYWSFITSDTNYTDTAKTGYITLKITEGDPQNIAISGLEGKTYGDVPFTASASVTTAGGAEATGHGQITWSSSNTNVAEINASTGQITIKSAGETNITAKAEKVSGQYAEGSATAALSIAKKTLTVDSITAENKEYDGTKAAKLTVTVSGILSGDTVTASAEGEFADAAAGTDKAVTVKNVKLEGDSAANYQMPVEYPEVKANIEKISADKVKAEFTDLNQKTGSIKAPSVKLEPADDSAVATVYIKKQVVKDETEEGSSETEVTTLAEDEEKEENVEWEWVEWTAETAPSEAGTYQVKATVTSDNFDGEINLVETTLTITKRSSSSGAAGGGGAAAVTYEVKIDTSANGKVSITPESAEKGKTVTITATPDNGYETASVKVTDAKGNAVEVTKNNDGTYSFKMPDDSVTISAEFTKKAETDTVCARMTDMDISMWYHESVHYVLEKGIMNGYSSEKFGPNNTLSRAMLAQILYNHAGKPAAATASYSDVKADDWFAAAVNWASANGVVTGFADGTFRPNENITREQLAVMLYRYAGKPETKGSLAAFKDAASVSDYAVTAMQWAVEKGIITGNGSADILNPQGNATRAQAAAMIMRYLENK